MKKILFAALTLILFTGCIKNDEKIFTGAQVEWDAATWNANTAPFTYPIMTRVPIYDFATPTSQPLITRTTTDTIKLRVNLVGPQRSTETQFRYQAVAGESSAVSGTNYEALSGTGTIPANSSFGFVNLKILNPGASATGPKILVLELLNNGSIVANVNYAKIGLSIAQN